MTRTPADVKSLAQSSRIPAAPKAVSPLDTSRELHSGRGPAHSQRSCGMERAQDTWTGSHVSQQRAVAPSCEQATGRSGVGAGPPGTFNWAAANSWDSSQEQHTRPLGAGPRVGALGPRLCGLGCGSRHLTGLGCELPACFWSTACYFQIKEKWQRAWMGSSRPREPWIYQHCFFGVHTSGSSLHSANSETLFNNQLRKCETGAKSKINARNPRTFQ